MHRLGFDFPCLTESWLVSFTQWDTEISRPLSVYQTGTDDNNGTADDDDDDDDSLITAWPKEQLEFAPVFSWRRVSTVKKGGQTITKWSNNIFMVCFETLRCLF